MTRPDYVSQSFPGRCTHFPPSDVFLLPYQTAWVKDSSRLKLCVKARQIGLSLASAFRVVTTKVVDDARLDAWISSRDELQAQLFLNDCKRFVSILQIGAQDQGKTVVDDDGNTALSLRFANGLCAHSMSSNPDAQAGKRGDRVLDEFALHPDPRRLYRTAYPGITWGGSLEIFSTHRGSFNFFNELLREATERGNPKGFSVHKITLQDALEQGFLYKLQSKLPFDDPRINMDETDYFNFVRAGAADEESFQQEFMCQPADDSAAFLTYDLIAGCEYQTGELWETDLLDCPNPLYLGVDVGREHDLTTMWLVEDVNGIKFTRRLIELSKQPFDVQEAELYRLLELRQVRRCCIDQSGIGRQFAERAIKRFGAYRVEGVDFTLQTKDELAYPVRAAFEDRTVKIPFTNAVRADLRGIRKEITASGNVRFAGERSRDGHCDRFWSLALALHAAKTPVSPGIASVHGIRYGNTSAALGRSFTPRTLARGPIQRVFQT